MVKLTAKAKEPNFLGRLGENNFAVIRFPEAAAVFAQIPDAQVTILHQRPGDPAAYPVNPAYVRIEGGAVEWQIQSGDLATRGDGFAQLVFTQDNVVAKTLIYHTRIGNALDGAGDPPEPWESWQQQVADDADRAEAAAGLLEHPEAEAVSLPYGTPASASYEDGKFTFGIPAGAKGDPGEPGSDYVLTEEDKEEIAEKALESSTMDQKIQAAEDAAEDACKWATGNDRSGAPVPSTDPHYENNAKYWSQQAATEAGKVTGMTAQATTLQPGASATASYSNGVLSLGIPAGTDGQDGTDGVGVPSGGTTGQVLKKKSGTDYDTEWGNEPTAPVQDVQVNGTSVVSQGVANVPKAGSSSSNLGVVYASYYGGVEIDANGRVIVSNPTDAIVKAGTETYIPVTIAKQHRSAFYGLAKAAGDSTQSGSSNAVGTYTESAKSAISGMLNAPEMVSGSTPTINAKSGIRYICGEVSTISITPPSSGDVEVIFESGSTPTVLTVPNTVKFPAWFDPTDLEASVTYDIIITNGVYGVVTSWA